VVRHEHSERSGRSERPSHAPRPSHFDEEVVVRHEHGRPPRSPRPPPPASPSAPSGPLAIRQGGKQKGGREPFKRLICCCDGELDILLDEIQCLSSILIAFAGISQVTDCPITYLGTWLNSDDGQQSGELPQPSNVTRISRAIKPESSDGVPQVCYYHYGVGTQGGVVDRVVMGAVGEGLSDTVREAYSFLSNNYAPGDEIFLFGFSRGAFTVRSIAGLIGAVGLLTKKGIQYMPDVFKDVQHRRDPRYRPKHRDRPFPNKPSAGDPRYREELFRVLVACSFLSIRTDFELTAWYDTFKCMCESSRCVGYCRYVYPNLQ
jgi:hypothetical protein